MCYLENKLISLTEEEEHEDHVRKVPQYLREFGLHCQADRCQFRVQAVSFVRFIITSDGISINPGSIATNEEWPPPKLVWNV